MEAESDGAVTATVQRLRAARSVPHAVETEEALARLESALFAAPRTHHILDRYPLLRRLGQGTSGVVYLATDPRLDRKVAIKLLHARTIAVDGQSEGRARLLREAQAMARSPHPNVVAVYDVGTYDTESGESGVFIVMEYVEGPSLQVWLAAHHTWREVLDVFIAAGHGLAAAHRVGVTHRDFKPANVIVGEGGRARVLDFGLARGLERDDEDTLPADGSLDAKLALDGALTAEGTVLGTPAFMAPEQHAGRSADPASDQYSFCIALWEGLFGSRPFAGRSIEELAAAKQSGPPPVPGSDGVARRLGAALSRGLAIDPQHRWPSIEALVGELERATSTARPQRRVLLVAGGLASLALGGWLLARDDRPCTGAADRFAAVWNDDRRATIAAAFEAVELPYATTSFDRVSQRTQAFERAWTQQHRDACEAATEHRPELLDLQMACLDEQLRELDAVLSVFEAADAGTVEHAVEAVGRLAASSRCDDVDALLAEVPPPGDPVVATAVEGQRAELARVRALERSGRIAEARAVAQAVAERAATLDYAPLLAEALYVSAALEEDLGHYDIAAELLTRAHAIALESGHDRQAALASAQLVYLEGHRRGHLDAALEWAQAAEVEQKRAGVRDRSTLLMSLASAHHAAGRFEEAERNVVEALAIIEELGGPDDPRLGTVHNNLGEILRQRGELDRARVELELAHATVERIYGPDHPRLSQSINNLASIDLATDDLPRAEQGFRRVIEIREVALGADHPEVATALANLGVVLRRSERLDGAREAYARALAILQRHGPEDVRVAGVLFGLARVEHERGDLDAALEHVDRALALQEASLPGEHLDIARSLQTRALILAERGDLDAAQSSFTRGEAIKVRASGRGDEWVADSRFAFARALHERGESRDAVRLAERALTELAPDAALELRGELETWLAERRRYPGPSGAVDPAGL